MDSDQCDGQATSQRTMELPYHEVNTDGGAVLFAFRATRYRNLYHISNVRTIMFFLVLDSLDCTTQEFDQSTENPVPRVLVPSAIAISQN